MSKIQIQTQTRDWKYSGSRARSQVEARAMQALLRQSKHCAVLSGGECSYLATSKSVSDLLETLRGTLPAVLLDAKNMLAVISQARGSAGLNPSLALS